MLRKSSVFICFVLLFSINLFAAWPLRDSIEFQKRDGLPNFFNKIRHGDSVSIGFFGGSITETTGWRVKITDWMKSRYQTQKITTHNASIGASGSDYGVFRIKNDLLSKGSLDLVFVEFAVNDGDGNSQDVEKSMEGIVRQIRKNNIKTDICFIYTTQTQFLVDVANGKMNMSASKHDSIASYYKIPSIFLGLESYHILKSDTVVWQTKDTIKYHAPMYFEADSKQRYVFTYDGVHPTGRFGHKIYTDIISKNLQKIENDTIYKSRIIPNPIFIDNYEKAHIISIDSAYNFGYTLVNRLGVVDFIDSYSPSIHNYLLSENPLSIYQFSFKGSRFGLNLLMGPSMGNFIIEIDGVK